MNVLSEINLIVKSAALFKKRAPDSNVSVVRPAAPVKNPAPAPARKVDVAETPNKNTLPPQLDKSEFQEVYDFYNDVVPAIKARELGKADIPFSVKGTLGDLLGTHVSYGQLKKNVGAATRKDSSVKNGWRIILNSTTNPSKEQRKSDLSHELRHVFERLMEGKGLRLPGKSRELLQKVYRFEGKDWRPNNPGYWKTWGPEEMFTTNREHQLRAYLQLRQKVGRKPTAPEYFKFIKELPAEELVKMRKRLVNGYQTDVDKTISDDEIRKGIELYRKALMDVANVRGLQSSPYGTYGMGYLSSMRA